MVTLALSLTQSTHIRFGTQQTKSLHPSHIGSDTALVTELLEDFVLLCDSSTQVCYFVVCGAVFASVTKTIAVSAYLLLKAEKLLIQHQACVYFRLNLGIVADFSELFMHSPVFFHLFFKRF